MDVATIIAVLVLYATYLKCEIDCIEWKVDMLRMLHEDAKEAE